MEEKLDLILQQLGSVQHELGNVQHELGNVKHAIINLEKKQNHFEMKLNHFEKKLDHFEVKLDHVGNAVEKLAINHVKMLNKQDETNTKLDNFAIETRSHFKHVQFQLDTHTNIIKKD